MINDRELILAAARLARVSPEAWLEFLSHMKRISDRAKDACLETDASSFLERRGFALAFRDLVNVMDSCRKIASNIEKTRKQ